MEKFMGTPGPWEMDEFENIVHGNRDGWGRKNNVRVAGVSLPGRVTEEYRANSRLVAAAPELLEALQECVYRIDSIISNGKATTLDRNAAALAHAAINKALGKE